ncbi:MAG: hypothetical protein KAR44_12615 [Candidatus Aegiribacteria sp.]|nr:hypothetical protein [Candidatus Aegiribacteria sp.]
MAKCRSCGKKGFLMSVDENGLCRICSQKVYHDAKPRVRILTESMKLAEEGKTLKTRLSRCDLVLENAKHLLTYEKKGIGTISPSPSEIIGEFIQYRDQIVLEEAKIFADKAISKSEAASTPKTKTSALSQGLVKVREILDESQDSDIDTEIEENLRRMIFTVKLDGFTEAARKAKFKGNNKKAIDQYQEALFLIQEEGFADEMSSSVKDIDKEIDGLRSDN